MHDILLNLVKDVGFVNDIQADSRCLFLLHGHVNNTEHSRKAALEAQRLAKRFKADKQAALICGFLHDIGEIIPSGEMVTAAQELGVDIFEEERQYPILLHQKLSKVMASEVFGVQDAQVLNAIECHTTLRARPSTMDMILFVADKVVWDEKYNHAFIDEVLDGLEISLEKGAFAYLKYLMDNRDSLKVLHPWTLEAYNYLRKQGP